MVLQLSSFLQGNINCQYSDSDSQSCILGDSIHYVEHFMFKYSIAHSDSDSVVDSYIGGVLWNSNDSDCIIGDSDIMLDR